MLEHHEVKPESLGLGLARIEDLAGGSPEENARMLEAVLDGQAGPHRDIVLLNAAALLWVAGAAASLADGLPMAAASQK